MKILALKDLKDQFTIFFSTQIKKKESKKLRELTFIEVDVMNKGRSKRFPQFAERLVEHVQKNLQA